MSVAIVVASKAYDRRAPHLWLLMRNGLHDTYQRFRLALLPGVSEEIVLIEIGSLFRQGLLYKPLFKFLVLPMVEFQLLNYYRRP